MVIQYLHKYTLEQKYDHERWSGMCALNMDVIHTNTGIVNIGVLCWREHLLKKSGIWNKKAALRRWCSTRLNIRLTVDPEPSCEVTDARNKKSRSSCWHDCHKYKLDRPAIRSRIAWISSRLSAVLVMRLMGRSRKKIGFSRGRNKTDQFITVVCHCYVD